MSPLSRRDALKRMALGGAGLALVGRRGYAKPAIRSDDVEDLARRVRESTPDGIYDVAANAVQAGATHETLLSAAFIAGIEDIRPHGVGGKFHAVLMVESAFQLTGVSSERDAFLAAIWTLWDFKRCQERDRREEGDWVLPARPEVKFASEAQARKELFAAMKDWDAARADRAIVGLAPYHDRRSLFELLWVFGARCFVDIGHKIIFCAHAERTLRRVDWRLAEPALRSLMLGLLYTDDGGPQLSTFEKSRTMLEAFPDDWLEGAEDPERSAELLGLMRAAGSDESQQIVVDMFRDGVGPKTIWDGLRLYGTEIFYRRPAAATRRHGPVHSVTEINAFAHVFRSTQSEETKKLVMLQTAGWLSLLRDAQLKRFGTERTSDLDALGREFEGPTPSMRELFEQPSAAVTRVCIDREADGTAKYLAQLRHFLYERGFQDHQYKLIAVLHEEARSIHPRWASRLLAPAITYVPTAVDDETEMRQRSVRALRKAGLG